jgi:periplasmic divalent cation tolerance protein
MLDACIVLTTCGSEATAISIAEALVDKKLAACVSMVPGVKSYYFFGGDIHLDEEVQLVIKTHVRLFDKVSDLVTELHTYDVPEIMMFKLDAASQQFLQWLNQAVNV